MAAPLPSTGSDQFQNDGGLRLPTNRQELMEQAERPATISERAHWTNVDGVPYYLQRSATGPGGTEMSPGAEDVAFMPPPPVPVRPEGMNMWLLGALVVGGFYLWNRGQAPVATPTRKRKPTKRKAAKRKTTKRKTAKRKTPTRRKAAKRTTTRRKAPTRRKTAARRRPARRSRR